MEQRLVYSYSTQSRAFRGAESLLRLRVNLSGFPAMRESRIRYSIRKSHTRPESALPWELYEERTES